MCHRVNSYEILIMIHFKPAQVLQLTVISDIVTIHYRLLLTRLTHLNQMEFPSLDRWASQFLFKGNHVVFFIFVQILIEHSVSKQLRP